MHAVNKFTILRGDVNSRTEQTARMCLQDLAHPSSKSRHVTAAGNPKIIMMNSPVLYDLWYDHKKASADCEAACTGSSGTYLPQHSLLQTLKHIHWL